jgi:hypothetical protein
VWIVAVLVALPDPAYEGTYFWGAYHQDSLGPQPVAVSNPDTITAARVRLEAATGVLDEVDVPPGGAVILELPWQEFMLPYTGVEPLAYHLASDRPVTAAQFNGWLGSMDSSRLLPESASGTEHLVFARQGGISLLAVVASREGTEVTVVPTADTYGDGPVPRLRAGEEFTTTLGAFDVLSLAVEDGTNSDLTGTVVFSTTPVTVFGGNTGVTVPSGFGAADHLEEQMLPLRYWGTGYLAARSAVRKREFPLPGDDPDGAPDVWRILASSEATEVTTDPPQPGTPVLLDRGEFVEFESREPFAVTATKPVAVAQYLVGSLYLEAGGYGDPALVMLVPTPLFTPRHIVHLLEGGFRRSYLVVVAPEGETVLVDGAPVPGGEFQPIGASGFAAAQVTLWEDPITGLPEGEGTLRVEAGVPIAVYAYQYDIAGSQAYPGGMRFEEINVTVVCDAGGPYAVPCQGPETQVVLAAGGSSDPQGNPLTYRWQALDAFVTLDDPSLEAPTATVAGTGARRVRLTVDDGASRKSCEAEIMVLPGDPVGEVPTGEPVPLRVRRDGEVLDLLFGEALGNPWGYNIYEGQIGQYYSHGSLGCLGIPVEEAPGVLGLETALPSGSRYYLLTATGCGGEGPSGFSSAGEERDPDRNACGSE